jgi:hypothetical protein
MFNRPHRNGIAVGQPVGSSREFQVSGMEDPAEESRLRRHLPGAAVRALRPSTGE